MNSSVEVGMFAYFGRNKPPWRRTWSANL